MFKNTITEKGLSEFTNDLESEMIAFVRDVEKFECLEEDERTVISIFGEINFKRRYHQDKETEERVYLLEQLLKLEKERMLPNVKERLIEEPKLIMVYYSIIEKGKKTELKNKRHFGGIYSKKIYDLWEEVMTYIESNYDTEYLEKVYISGDGSNWIKIGSE